MTAIATGGLFGQWTGCGPGQVGVPPRGPHRLHLLDHRRGARPGRGAAGAGPVRRPLRVLRVADRAAGPRSLRHARGRGDHRLDVVQAVVNLGAVLGVLPDHRRAAALRVLRGSAMLVTMARHRHAAEHRPTVGLMAPTWCVIAGGGTAGHLLPGPGGGRGVGAPGPCPQCHPLRRERTADRSPLVAEASGFDFTTLPGRGIQRRLTLENLAAAWGLMQRLLPGGSALRAASAPRWSWPWVATPASPVRSAARLLRDSLGRGRAERPGRLGQPGGRSLCTVPVPLPSKAPTFLGPWSPGIPVRSEILAVDRAPTARQPARHWAYPRDRVVVLVFAGSLGARHDQRSPSAERPRDVAGPLRSWRSATSSGSRLGASHPSWPI